MFIINILHAYFRQTSRWITLFSLLFLGLQVPTVSASEIHVGESQACQTIGEALETADAYDHIVVHSGVYHETSLIVSKPLRLSALAGVVVDAQQETADIFIITADSVEISGFELRNVGVSFLKEYSAIRIRNARYTTLRNNHIQYCFFGIYLEYAQRTEIIDNQITGQFSDEASAGNAIHAWKGKDLRIVGNTLTGHRDGIYFEFVDDSFIEQNNSYNNLRYGLHFMFSNRDDYRKNTFRNNGSGVAVMFSRQIKMIDNAFLHNWGGAAYGLLLKEISDGEITGNRFVQNTVGILAEGANRLHIAQNQFTNNGTAIDMKGNCLDNRVEANNFLANTFEVVTNSKYNNNSYRHNYWSGYKGYDLNRDGIGDVPYRPVNLFAKITNEIPSATIMLHSTFVNLLEMGEKIFPQLIPAELIDETPKMRPYHYD